jgi:hypothetical protein
MRLLNRREFNGLCVAVVVRSAAMIFEKAPDVA